MQCLLHCRISLHFRFSFQDSAMRFHKNLMRLKKSKSESLFRYDYVESFFEPEKNSDRKEAASYFVGQFCYFPGKAAPAFSNLTRGLNRTSFHALSPKQLTKDISAATAI